ncbi:pyruvate kinase [Geothermobacter hydrogeniphilus]|uniref:Pyruvate kinase n=1 Tax=Geothermobacter hydrogeniphilus TaxID=1969733 RepID=A0A1X0XZ90_9BACT|nr:pyruvate kinase [Geothermobacter hydrogeniphilus]ORJ58240.1 pyruvate kinase [Geothermobacter hydrogeniphilus]
MQRKFRHAKIVATLGPASSTEERLDALLDAGADLFRLNFSHGTRDEKRELIARIRDLSRRRQRAVAILGDLQGPKIRVGKLEQGMLKLIAGEQVWITTENLVGKDHLIPSGYAGLPNDVRPGDRILLDDGLLELEVTEVDPPLVGCRVIVGGILKDHKGINLPGVAVSAPAMTEKDWTDLDFCIEQQVDYVALSFVRSPDEVENLKQHLLEKESPIQVIAKIEKPEAVEVFDAILEVSDGIMVARGDLGVEIHPEKVPLIQKRIIRQCNHAGKPVITATQMLESMINNPRPTRAETSDVANAILDGSDAVMLSAETASGRYPVEAVQLMERVALDVEADPALREQVFSPLAEVDGWRSLPEAISQAACRVAENLGAAAILAFTQTGKTAALVAKYRPRVPIYAVTPSETVRRRLALYHGVRSLRVKIEGDTEAQIEAVAKTVLEAGILQRGEVVVITMGSPVSAPGTTNLLKVHRLGTGDYYEVH